MRAHLKKHFSAIRELFVAKLLIRLGSCSGVALVMVAADTPCAELPRGLPSTGIAASAARTPSTHLREMIESVSSRIVAIPAVVIGR